MEFWYDIIKSFISQNKTNFSYEFNWQIKLILFFKFQILIYF